MASTDSKGPSTNTRATTSWRCSARIGINSGEVVVGRIGDDLRMDYTAQRHMVGLAQRMETRAAADSTYLTGNTARLVDRCRARGIRVNVAHCPAHGKDIPRPPFLEFVRDIFEFESDDSDHDARRKISGELALLDDKLQTMPPLLFDFLGVADPAKPPLQLSPEAREQQLYAFVHHLPEARSREATRPAPSGRRPQHRRPRMREARRK